MRRRNLLGIALGAVFTAAAGYWFTIGRRELDVDHQDVEPGAAT